MGKNGEGLFNRGKLATAMTIVSALNQRARERGLSDGEVELLASPKGEKTLDRFVDVMVDVSKREVPVRIRPNSNAYPVFVGYGLSFAELMTSGQFARVNADCRKENIPLVSRKDGMTELVLLQFGRRMTTARILTAMSHMGLRPAELPELVAFSVAFQDAQRKSWIMGLGSPWKYMEGYSAVPYLHAFGEGRVLDLRWTQPDMRWDVDIRFLAAHMS